MSHWNIAQGLDDSHTYKRRIRHITAVQIRNLTPFPVRDAFTSALAAPLDATQLTVADDIEVTPARRRRRISSSSITTVTGAHSIDERAGSDFPSVRSKSRTASRGSMTSNRAPVTSISTKSRSRTTSTSQTSSVPPKDEQDAVSMIPLAHFSSSTLPRNTTWASWKSQDELMHILSSRLVESFLTLSTVDGNTNNHVDHGDILVGGTALSYDDVSSVSKSSISLSGKIKNRRHDSLPQSNGDIQPRRGSKSRSAIRHLAELKKPASALNNSQRRNSDIPFYISPLHPPSTNPSFEDIESLVDFADWVDQNGSHLLIHLWGKSEGEWGMGVNLQECSQGTKDEVVRWRILSQWMVDLNELVPLAPGLSSLVETNLAPNTLVIELGTLGRFSYKPPLEISRPPSRGSLSGIEALPSSSSRPRSGIQHGDRDGFPNANSHESKAKRSFGWQDLISLLSLQSSIMEISENLCDVLAHCDTLYRLNIARILKREASELQEKSLDLRTRLHACRDQTSSVQEAIMQKRQRLNDRRVNLDQARLIQNTHLAQQTEACRRLEELQQKHHVIQEETLAFRGALFSRLSDTFPIDLISASDLLYAILSIPLPIPVSTSDPAPPMSSQTVPDYNEETVASALGIVCQVLQLCAAYMGQALPYPITCIGSRSNIKDPISVMMGPRKFPLYSKGVDTYRFEYAVYLLNKDLESLMAAQELKALDMRHTLPNLKNLLLTLSSGDFPPSWKHKQSQDKIHAATEGGETNIFVGDSENRHQIVSPSTTSSTFKWNGYPFASSWSIFRSRNRPDGNLSVLQATDGDAGEQRIAVHSGQDGHESSILRQLNGQAEDR